jgi:hypothetical protein
MKKVLGFSAALIFLSFSAYGHNQGRPAIVDWERPAMGIHVSQFSLDGMAGTAVAGVHYDLSDSSALRVGLGIANEGPTMFKKIDIGLAYRMFGEKSGAVRPFIEGFLSVDNVSNVDAMGISVGAGFGGEWFYNDNISLELSTGLGFNMVKDAAIPADIGTGTAEEPEFPAVAATSVNSVVTWTSGVGFNLYW